MKHKVRRYWIWHTGFGQRIKDQHSVYADTPANAAAQFFRYPHNKNIDMVTVENHKGQWRHYRRQKPKSNRVSPVVLKNGLFMEPAMADKR